MASSRFSANSLFGSPLRASLGPHGAGAGGNRLDDVVVSGAPAQVAVELVPDGLLVELVALATHHIERRHDHAGRAEPALQSVVLAERLLHRMQLVAPGHRLDGGDVGALE